ncbi:64f41ffa-722a-4e75-b546-f1596865c774 [Sclerotinia trifoliorum]|uniref:64f41ffa-722a-4e75-b546-f1596865c774 n=1 Tax=Sclerotinia trifoliorum TaxID=28548 RepID=A0A8H2ZRR3_9HELO|nr:64f41ffa-722a-4e75-b546-f1596865c774 [Sclerotinia trifoliorum]
MSRNILVFAWIITICFINNATSKKVALTGLKPQSLSPIQTSITEDIKTPTTGTSLTKSPTPTSPPRKAIFPTFQVAKRESYPESCGDYEIPGFSLELDSGQTCLVDENGLMFGACATRISDPNNCGWAEICVDRHACTSSCGRTSVPNLSVTTCGGNRDGNDYCAMWYLVTETYIYTSITCSDRQSWQTWDATLVTSMSVNLATLFTTTAAAPTSTSKSEISSTLTISVANVSGEGNSSTVYSGPHDSNHSLGAIIGGVVGGLGAVSILAGLAWFFHRRMESEKRASRALAFDPGHSSSDDPDPPNVIGSTQAGSHHSVRSSKLTGGPGQGYPRMSYVDSPLGSPNIDGSIHNGGIRTSMVTTPGGAPSVHSAYADNPVHEMHADTIGPAELQA